MSQVTLVMAVNASVLTRQVLTPKSKACSVADALCQEFHLPHLRNVDISWELVVNF